MEEFFKESSNSGVNVSVCIFGLAGVLPPKPPDDERSITGNSDPSHYGLISRMLCHMSKDLEEGPTNGYMDKSIG